MQKDLLVSVIIPNYNHAKYLDQRIQSVLCQTYQNFEVIILDDCSTDDGASHAVIEKYRNNNHVMHIVYNVVNSGSTFKQWLKGISLAAGDVVWIAESDDFCEPNMLELLINAYMHNPNTVLAYTSLVYVNSEGIPYSTDSNNAPNIYMTGKQFLTRYMLMYNTVKNASGAIFSKKAAMQVSPKFLQYPGAGDYLFWVEIAAQGNVAIVNKGLSFFRRHEGVVTSKRDRDGSNLTAEKEILTYIISLIHPSSFRNRLTYANHARRIKDKEFDSIDTKNRIYEIWEVEKHSTLLDRVILKISDLYLYFFKKRI